MDNQAIKYNLQDMVNIINFYKSIVVSKVIPYNDLLKILTEYPDIVPYLKFYKKDMNILVHLILENKYRAVKIILQNKLFDLNEKYNDRVPFDYYLCGDINFNFEILRMFVEGTDIDDEIYNLLLKHLSHIFMQYGSPVAKQLIAKLNKIDITKQNIYFFLTLFEYFKNKKIIDMLNFLINNSKDSCVSYGNLITESFINSKNKNEKENIFKLLIEKNIDIDKICIDDYNKPFLQYVIDKNIYELMEFMVKYQMFTDMIDDFILRVVDNILMNRVDETDDIKIYDFVNILNEKTSKINDLIVNTDKSELEKLFNCTIKNSLYNTAKFFIKNGYITAITSEDETLLIRLINSKNFENFQNVELFQLLLGDANNINKVWEGRTALSYLISSNNIKLNTFVKILVDNGADVNYVTTCNKNSILIDAVYYNCHNCLEILLKAGAKPNEYDCKGMPAIYYASILINDSIPMKQTYKNKLKMLKILEKYGGDKNFIVDGNRLIVHIIDYYFSTSRMCNIDSKIVKFFLETENIVGDLKVWNNYLFYLLSVINVDMCEYLIKKGLDLNCVNSVHCKKNNIINEYLPIQYYMYIILNEKYNKYCEKMKQYDDWKDGYVLLFKYDNNYEHDGIVDIWRCDYSHYYVYVDSYYINDDNDADEINDISDVNDDTDDENYDTDDNYDIYDNDDNDDDNDENDDNDDNDDNYENNDDDDCNTYSNYLSSNDIQYDLQVLKLLKIMIDNGANMYFIDNQGRTFLIYFITEIIKKEKDKYKYVVKDIVNKMFQLIFDFYSNDKNPPYNMFDAQCSSGNTALMYLLNSISSVSYKNILENLIISTNPDIINHDGKTAYNIYESQIINYNLGEEYIDYLKNDTIVIKKSSRNI